MTREDIILLVERRKRIEPPPLLDALKEGELYWMLGSRDVLWVVEQAVAHEREACAKVCDEREQPNLYKFRECAAAIRKRGEV